MAKLYDGPILIIKCAWGGTNLHTDWRPPSAGPVRLEEFTGSRRERLKFKKIDPDEWQAQRMRRPVTSTESRSNT